MFQTKVEEKIETHFTLKNVFPTIMPLRDTVEKYGGAREAADGRTAARCMLD
jgi:hypothetical protein